MSDVNLAPAQPRSDGEAAGAVAARMVSRVRFLMLVSGLTTLIAIAAVIGVIGYRVSRTGGSSAVAPAEGTILLPKGARVVATAIVGESIVVTLDVAGVTEIRTFDAKTLQQIGRIKFAPEP